MSVKQQIKNQHLLWRACFGVSAEQIQTLQQKHETDLYKEIEKYSSGTPEFIKVSNEENACQFMTPKFQEEMNGRENQLSDEKKKMIRIKNVQDIKELNKRWLDEMVNSHGQLRERMAFFWHGHFACRDININHQQMLLHVIRSNALENFADLLKAVSKSAAMLQFLNNQQNRKQHPNENFAREVMELFTLGRGSYTENDIKEAARAFTGWGFDNHGQFVFRNFFHDQSAKTVLGKTGNFNGDDVLNILLEQKNTAVFVTKKIYRYFVNDKTEDEKIEVLAKNFYESNYDIKQLMKEIFTSNWFYDEKNIGIKIKSPVELIAGIRRILPMNIHNPDMQLLLQKVLGQVLFYPPNVAGWPGGKSWIDSSTLMMRLRIPQLMQQAELFNITPKADDDQQMGMQQDVMQQNKIAFSNFAEIRWNQFTEQFNKTLDTQLFIELQRVLLQTKSGSVNSSAIKNAGNGQSAEENIKSLVIALMSTPEYQLC